jgi:uncharacterized YccA/Bax inhibitor family protein
MQSNNPVFARSEPLARSLQSGVGFHAPAPSADQLSAMYRTPSGMTLDDVIVKTGLLLGTMVVTGAAAWVLDVGAGIIALAGITGFVLAMVNIFKKQVSPPLVLAYAAAQGVFIGAISHVYAGAFGGGIVTQAVLGTTVVFGAVLLGYKSGRLRNTPKFQKVVTLGLLGMVASVAVNLLAACSATATRSASAARTSPVGPRQRRADRLRRTDLRHGLRPGRPHGRRRRAGEGVVAVAFGLVVGLVFLYLEILRLLSYFQGRD